MSVPFQPVESRMSALTWGLLLLLGLLWGASFFFGRVAVQHVPAFTLVFLRAAIAALVLHLYVFGRYGIYRELRARWRDFLVLGLINSALPHSLIFLGQTQIGAGLASILNATTPIWTVLIAHRLTADEKLTRAKLAGTVLGLAGTVVLIGPSALGHLMPASSTAPAGAGMTAAGIPLWAVLLPVGAAISYGFAAIHGRRFRPLAAPVTAAGQLTASALLMLPVSLAVDHPWALPMPPVTTILAVLALALASTAYGYILYFRIMARAGATNTSLVTLLVPPSALLFGILFLGERLETLDLAGMALIAAGLVVLDGRVLGRFTK